RPRLREVRLPPSLGYVTVFARHEAIFASLPSSRGMSPIITRLHPRHREVHCVFARHEAIFASLPSSRGMSPVIARLHPRHREVHFVFARYEAIFYSDW